MTVRGFPRSDPRTKPRVVRNFWLTAKIDGRETVLTGGPADRSGGFQETIQVRHEGDVRTAVEIDGRLIQGDLGTYLRITVLMRTADGVEQREFLDFPQ